MKKTVTREVEFCDAPGCNAEVSYMTPCMKCGIVFCYEHSESMMVSFPHGVHFSGSGDGRFCKKCAAELDDDGDDPLFESYKRIADLRTPRGSASSRTIAAERRSTAERGTGEDRRQESRRRRGTPSETIG